MSARVAGVRSDVFIGSYQVRESGLELVRVDDARYCILESWKALRTPKPRSQAICAAIKLWYRKVMPFIKENLTSLLCSNKAGLV